jgi:hypothetical protein
MSFLEDWAWLLANHPWKYEGEKETRATVMLGLAPASVGSDEYVPAVIVMDTWWDGGIPTVEDSELGYNWAIGSDTWEGALAKAIGLARAETEEK